MAGIDWKGDAASAFAQGKPVFMYWGAGWCPPCNRGKAQVFGRADFAALAREAFVPLAIDGDMPNAQALAAQYKMRSYPTMILFRPDGSEITRLPCEVDGERFIALLKLALNAQRTAADMLAAAPALSDDEWRLLSFYSWDTDEGVLLGQRALAPTLSALAAACPLPEAATRFAWFAMQAGAPLDAARIEAVLRDPAAVRAQLDIVSNLAVDFVRALPQLAAPWSAALAALETDLGVHALDRLQALRTRVCLTRFGAAIPNMEGIARARVEAALLLAGDPYARHVALNTGAGVLSDAGLLDEAEATLRAGLAASHAPYYFMHNLATIAKKRKDYGLALDWYEQAWRSAKGSATRLQWGVTYMLALQELAPDANARMAEALAAFRPEVAATPDARSQRNGVQLSKLESKAGVVLSA